MRIIFEVKPGNKLKRVRDADKRDRKEARNNKLARQRLYA